MNKADLKHIISAYNATIEFPEEESEYLTLNITAAQTHELIAWLRSDSQLLFDYMFCQTAVDFPTHIEVIYHLSATSLKHELVVKAKIEDRENAVIDSVYDLYKTAEFLEREIYDLFGVKFNNHPDLRRIFLEDDWEGYPLRKDYVDEINIVEL